MPTLNYTRLPTPREKFRLLPFICVDLAVVSFALVFVPIQFSLLGCVSVEGAMISVVLAGLAVTATLAALFQRVSPERRGLHHAVLLAAVFLSAIPLIHYRETWQVALGLKFSREERESGASFFAITHRWKLDDRHRMLHARIERGWDIYQAWFLYQIPPEEIDEYVADLKAFGKATEQGHSGMRDGPGWFDVSGIPDRRPFGLPGGGYVVVSKSRGLVYLRR